jgi:hypothetical protein
MSFPVDTESGTHANRFVNAVADLQLNVLSFAGHPYVCASQFAKQVQGWSSFLP